MIFGKNSKKENQNSIDEAAAAKERLQKEKESLLAEIKGIGNADPNAPKNASDSPGDSGMAATRKADFTPPEDLTDDDLEDAFSQPAVMDTNITPLPKHTKGVLIIPIMVLVTILGVIAGHLPYIKMGIPSSKVVIYIYMGFGVLLFILGGMIIIAAISDCQIFTNIELGKLVTSGIYSKTRNPIYCGVLFICTAALFISGNAFMYVLPFAYYIAIIIVVQKTEEPLLVERFAYDYVEYMAATNRVIPIPKKASKPKSENESK